MSEATLSKETQTESVLHVLRKEIKRLNKKVSDSCLGYSEALSYIDQLLADGQKLKVSVTKKSKALAAREAWVEARAIAVSWEWDILVCQQSAGDLHGLVDQYVEAQQRDVSEFNSLLLEENGPDHERLIVRLVCRNVELMRNFVDTEKKLTHVLSKLVGFYRCAGESGLQGQVFRVSLQGW